ncbi:galactosylceramide sulfotransferase-like [Glandiceps talaboti]
MSSIEVHNRGWEFIHSRPSRCVWRPRRTHFVAIVIVSFTIGLLFLHATDVTFDHVYDQLKFEINMKGYMKTVEPYTHLTTANNSLYKGTTIPPPQWNLFQLEQDMLNIVSKFNTENNHDDKPFCKPEDHFVFVKTGKTGSSTVSSLLARYGLLNDLVVGINPNFHAFIDFDDKTNELLIYRYNCTHFPGYNFIASHIQYHRSAMDAVVGKKAKYLTILRHPYTHARSSFYFSGKDKEFPNTKNPFNEFLKLADVRHAQNETYCESKNGYCIRFGLPLNVDEDSRILNMQRLDKELDLVMLMEYFDESLILLKKEMCWGFEDIVYHAMKVHSEPQAPITKEMERIMATISVPDLEIYDFFNKTFWDKIRNYDGHFAADLARFRSLQRVYADRCDREAESEFCRFLSADANEMNRRVYLNNRKNIC